MSLIVGKRQSALDYLRSYTNNAGEDVPSLVLAADAYFSLKHYDDAFELASRAREIAFHEKAQRILGLVYQVRGDDAKALQHLEKAEPDSVVLTAMMRSMINLGKLRDLEGCVEKAGRIDKPAEGLKRACDRARALLSRRTELAKKVSVSTGDEAEYAEALDAFCCAEEAYQRHQSTARINVLLTKAIRPLIEIGPALALRGRLSSSAASCRLLWWMRIGPSS